MKRIHLIRFANHALLVVVLLLLLIWPAWVVLAATSYSSAHHARLAGSESIYLPIAVKNEPSATPSPTPSPIASPTPFTCEIAGVRYEKIPIKGIPDTERDDAEHADLNLAVRGYEEVDEFKGLVKYDGAIDSQAPQLAGLFADDRTPAFSSTYRVYDWDWANNERGDLISNWDVTLAGLLTTAGETIHVPDREGPDIFQGRFKVLVIYANENFITLKYTRNDNVVFGYTIHVENVCVEPSLLELYREGNEAGRTELPALAAGQAFGRANGAEIRVAIRDTGSFMDPRSRKDWWRGNR